jgi:nucleotide-binding universal stress UspA family protein
MLIQSILVGLDWGETADATAGVAVELAIATKAAVKALYVEDEELIRAAQRVSLGSIPTAGTIPLAVPNMGDLEAEFQSEEQVLGRHFLGLVADTRIRGSFLVAQGDVDRILLRESRAHDLLVVGKYSETHREGRGGRPLGRHVERILQHAWCPVVLVPPGAVLGPRTLVAYDGSEESYRALAAAVRLTQAIQGQLRVLAVAPLEIAHGLLDQADAYLATHRTESDLVARDGNIAEQILRETEDWGADLVAMGAFAPPRRRESFGAGVTLDVLVGLPRAALLCGRMDED